MPGLRQIEHHAVDIRFLNALPNVTLLNLKLRVFGHGGSDVGFRPFNHVKAQVVGENFALGSHCSQERNRDGPGAGACLYYPCSGKYVAQSDDRAQVLWVDDRGDSRHQPRKVRHRRLERQYRVCTVGLHACSLRLTNQVAVVEVAEMGVKALPILQLEHVASTLSVEYEGMVAFLEYVSGGGFLAHCARASCGPFWVWTNNMCGRSP